MSKGGSSKQKVYDYFLSIDYGICHGPVDSINSLEAKDKVMRALPVTLNSASYTQNSKLWGGDKKEGGIAGVIEYYLGGWDQKMSAELAGRFELTSDTAPGYRGIAHVLFRGGTTTATPTNIASTGNPTLDILVGATGNPDGNGTTTITSLFAMLLGLSSSGGNARAGFKWIRNSPYIPPATANVTRGAKGLLEDSYIWPITGITGGAYDLATYEQAFPAQNQIDKTKLPDTNPAAIIYECMTNADWGKGELESAMDTQSYLDAAATLLAENFGLSLRWMRQDKIENFVAEVQDHIKAMHFQHPRTGLWTLKLIRGDYDIADLDTLDPSNCTLEKFKRGQWSETTNQINVSYTNPKTEKEEIVSSLNLASIAIVGGVKADTRDYHGVRNPWLAKFIANRDLAESSRVLSTATVYGNRSHMDYVPGDVVLFTWPDEGVDSMPMRVFGVTPGSPSDRRVKLDLTEDVFSEPVPPVSDSFQPPVGPSVITVPEDLDYVHIMSPPMPLMVQSGYSAAELDAEYPAATVGFWLSHQPRPEEIDVVTDVVLGDGSIVKDSVASITPVYWARLLDELPAEAVSTLPDALVFTLAAGTPEPGQRALIGYSEVEQEIIMLGAFDSGSETWTVYRGIYDTIPRTWPANTLLLGFEPGEEMADRVERAVGETISYRFRPVTIAGQLDWSDSSEYTYTVPDRTYAPFRPANVQIDGNDFAHTQYLTGTVPATITATWANRNRLSEDAVAQQWNAANVTPEVGQTTTIRFRDSIGGVLEHEITGLTGTSSVVTIGGSLEGYRFYDMEIVSVRDGVESWQAVTRTLEIERLGYGSNYGYDYGENDGD